MKARKITGTLAAAALVVTGATGAVAAPAPERAAAATSASDIRLGKKLVTKYFNALRKQDRPALKKMLSPAFQVARADGSTAGRAAYLKAIPEVHEFTVNKFDVTRAEHELVARYSVVTTELINGEHLSKDPALRLTVFVRDDDSDRWRIIAHSNFNTPVKTS